MAGTWTSDRFPQFEDAIRRLAERHRELEDEPLHLAIAYDPRRDRDDVFLFEVIGGSEAAGVNVDRELFETTFAASPGFPMELNQRLHLVLTTPHEFETALRDDWPSIHEIMSAIRRDDYQVLHADKIGQRVLKRMQSGVKRPRGAARG